MKAIFPIIAALLLGAVSLSAQEPYFCTMAGHKLYYERYKPDMKKIIQTTTFEIESVRPEGEGRRIEYYLTLRKGNGRAMYGGRSFLSVDVNPEGDVMLDVGATARAILQGLSKSANIKTEGEKTILPSHLHPGDTLPESSCTLSVSGIKLRIHIRDRKILREETITTPAGTFDCIVTRERKIENGPLHHLNNWLDNWYARGVGYVRHDIYDKDMEFEGSEILVRIE